MSSNQQHENWNECPPGELSQLAGRLNTSRQRARRKQLFTNTAACMLLVACGVFVVGSLIDTGGPRFGGITCSECKANFVAYHGHKTEVAPIEDSLVNSMAIHLEQCQICRDFFEQTYPGVLSAEKSHQLLMPVFAVASSSPSY